VADVDPQYQENFVRVIHELVDELIDERWNVENQLHQGFGKQESRDLVKQVAQLAANICGMAVLRGASLNPVSAERDSWLAAIEERLELAAVMLDFSDVETAQPFSMQSVIAEVHAIRSGDQPQLFARLPGRKRAWRARIGRWRALHLDAFGDGMGIPSAERHRVIADAYSTTWDTIRKWEDQPPGSTPSQDKIRVTAGEELERSRRQGRSNREGWTQLAWEQAVKSAAAIYREERRSAAD
jgi:hypothetical protein